MRTFLNVSDYNVLEYHPPVLVLEVSLVELIRLSEGLNLPVQFGFFGGVHE